MDFHSKRKMFSKLTLSTLSVCTPYFPPKPFEWSEKNKIVNSDRHTAYYKLVTNCFQSCITDKEPFLKVHVYMCMLRRIVLQQRRIHLCQEKISLIRWKPLKVRFKKKLKHTFLWSMFFCLSLVFKANSCLRRD